MSAGKCFILQRDGGAMPTYSCDTCGTVFNIADGNLIECPTCAAIADAPELKACPHCGSPANLIPEWDQEHGKTRRFRAICRVCGCQTRACNYADDAAGSWNDRVEAGE